MTLNQRLRKGLILFVAQNTIYIDCIHVAGNKEILTLSSPFMLRARLILLQLFRYVLTLFLDLS